MLAVAVRTPICSSSSRLARCLLPHSTLSTSSSTGQQHNHKVQSLLNQFVIRLNSWKLTHQPREPAIHWNPRFRALQQSNIDDSPVVENWDSWFDRTPSSSSNLNPPEPNSFLSDQLYLLELPMSKRPRESSPTVQETYKREKHHHHHHHHHRYHRWELPKRVWSNTNYEHRLAKIHHEHFLFHLISYNILAQRLIEDNRFLYEDCHEHHLHWHRRRDQLLNEILKQNADIICLQEMQREHYQHDFRPAMADEGYDSIYIKRSGNKLDGCCLFYKADRLRLVASRTVPFFQQNIQLLDRDNCGLMALFRPVHSDARSNDLFCVATTHLLFSPKRGDIKLAQLQYFLAEIDRFAMKDSNTNTYYPIIICGDFNAQPQSPLMNFLIDGQIQYNSYRRIEISGQIPERLVHNQFSLPLPSNELLPTSFVTADCRFPSSTRTSTTNLNDDQLILQAYMHRTSSARLTHNKRFFSAYDLDDVSKVTTRIDKDSNLVDYILYTQQDDDPHRLNLLGRYNLYDQNQMAHIHLPNHQFASDHFLLAAKFALKLQKKKNKKK